MGDLKKTMVAVTIDFEDFSYDLKRSLGAPTSALSIRENELLHAYEKINAFLKGMGGAPCATFFCTGILAQLFPAVVERIAFDGHEIGCHYHFHDDFNADNAILARKRLVDATNALEEASNQQIVGFRAPRFSLTPANDDHLELLKEFFSYDSSILSTRSKNLQIDRSSKNLRFFPVTARRTHKLLPAIRPGGSYFRLLNNNLILKTLVHSETVGELPILYLHPYDFTCDREFMLSENDLRFLPLFKRKFWYYRQFQWHVLGNLNLERRLVDLQDRIENIGPLKGLI